jgi:hypothetical protein
LVHNPQMLKRKPSRELHVGGGPHVSVFGRDPTRRQKRLFRSRNDNKHSWQPETERAMTELLDFILQHEEAFRKYTRPKPAFPVRKLTISQPVPPLVTLRRLPPATRGEPRRIPCKHSSMDKSAYRRLASGCNTHTRDNT